MNKFSIAELAGSLSVQYEGDPSCKIAGINGLEFAGPDDASFLANPRYKETMKRSKAGVICIDKKGPRYPGQNYLVSNDPSRTFQELVEILFPNFKTKTSFEKIHPTAVIHPSAKIGEGVVIGPNSVIDGNVEIGEATFIAANVTILHGAKIGTNCTIYPACVIREGCVLQNRVILQPGAIIGSCGFGYTTNAEMIHTKLEQVGNVVLEDDVEIGANTTIDRARFKTTIISKGTKIDNLVQIAHNVKIGEHNIIAAQTGIAGSTKTGKGVMFGGQCGILGHIEITDFSLIATRSGISKNIKTPGKYQGSPAMPMEEYKRQKVHIRKLESYLNRIKNLEQEIQAIKEKLPS